MEEKQKKVAHKVLLEEIERSYSITESQTSNPWGLEGINDSVRNGTIYALCSVLVRIKIPQKQLPLVIKKLETIKKRYEGSLPRCTSVIDAITLLKKIKPSKINSD